MKESSTSNGLKNKLAATGGGVPKRRIQATFLGPIGQTDTLIQSIPKQSSSTLKSIASTTPTPFHQKYSSEQRMVTEMTTDNVPCNPILSSSGPQSHKCTDKDMEDAEESIDLLDSDQTDSLLEQLPLLTSRPILRPLPVLFNVTKKDSCSLVIPTPTKELVGTFEKSDQCSVVKVVVFNDLSGKSGTSRCAKLTAHSQNTTSDTLVKKQIVGSVVWEVLLNSPVTLLQANNQWTVAVSERTVHMLHSSTGKSSKYIHMDAVICILHLQQDICLAVDCKYNLFTWNLKTSSLVVKKSLAFLLKANESQLVHQSVSPTGIPLLIFNTGDAYVYLKPMDMWLTLNTGFNNILMRIVGQLKLVAKSVPNGLIAMLSKHLPKGEDKPIANHQVNEAGEELQLETLLRACTALQSPFETRFLINIYVQKLAKRGKWTKLVECMQELQNHPIEGGDLTQKMAEDVENILQVYGTTLNQLLALKEEVDLSFMD